MNREKHIKHVSARAFAVVVGGLVILVCGIVGIYTSRSMQHAYADGNWSVSAVRNSLNIDSWDTLKTRNETALFEALIRMNEQCQSDARLFAGCSVVLAVWGVVLLAIGSLQVRDAGRLKQRGAEQPADSASAPRPDAKRGALQ